MLASLLLGSCASPGPPAPTSRGPAREGPYLLAPLTGYPLTTDADVTRRLEAVHGGLAAGRDLAEIEAAGRGLLEEDPGYHPAKVLLAQVEYLRGEDTAVLELLQPVLDELPDYTAAQLLFGHAAERSGDLPAALSAFARLGEANGLAARRAEKILPRAIEIVFFRLQEEIDRGRIEGAEAHLAWLEEWAEGSPITLEGARQVAVERGDLEAELEIVRRLAEGEGSARQHRERLAHLELEIGDVEAGLGLFEDLVRSDPEDLALADQLERAKFLWRMQLLPPRVQETGRKGEIDRADFATLLYWLVPRVRYSQVTNPPIATDILDHPRRDEILRVLNLDLMAVNETLHRFDPTAPATRRKVFEALLALLESSPVALSCLAESEARSISGSGQPVCRQAADCGLIPEEADCLPAATISGAEALELFRHTLGLLGSGE